jgi:hypothetical protein
MSVKRRGWYPAICSFLRGVLGRSLGRSWFVGRMKCERQYLYCKCSSEVSVDGAKIWMTLIFGDVPCPLPVCS